MIYFAHAECVSPDASGHHSQAIFDLDSQITLEGRIVQVNWGSPHSLFFLEGKKVGEPDSEIKRWAMEGPSPVGLTRTVWTQDLLKVGDRITASGNGSRTGRPLMLLKEVATPDGKVWQTGVQGNFKTAGWPKCPRLCRSAPHVVSSSWGLTPFHWKFATARAVPVSSRMCMPVPARSAL